MSRYTTDSIVRVAEAGVGGLILGSDLSVDSIVRIVQSTSGVITVKAGSRTTEALVKIVQSGGKRVIVDFS